MLKNLKNAYKLGKEQSHLELGSNFSAQRGTCSNFPLPGSYRCGTHKDNVEACLRINEMSLAVESFSVLERAAYKLGRDAGLNDRNKLFASQRARTKELESLLDGGLGDDIHDWFFRASPYLFYDPDSDEPLAENGKYGGYVKDYWIGLTHDSLLEFHADYRVDEPERASAEIVDIFKKHCYVQIYLEKLGNDKNTNKKGGPFYFKKP